MATASKVIRLDSLNTLDNPGLKGTNKWIN